MSVDHRGKKWFFFTFYSINKMLGLRQTKSGSCMTNVHGSKFLSNYMYMLQYECIQNAVQMVGVVGRNSAFMPHVFSGWS